MHQFQEWHTTAKGGAIVWSGTSATAGSAVALVPDKAWDDPTAHPELIEQAAAAVTPPLDPLSHDEAFLAGVATRAIDMGQTATCTPWTACTPTTGCDPRPRRRGGRSSR